VANHPQSLWISLWTGFRRERQVVLPKGFFFLCLRIERFDFRCNFNHIRPLCPLRQSAAAVQQILSAAGNTAVDSSHGGFRSDNRACQESYAGFAHSYIPMA
jgi:hypothetical protein